MWAIKAIGAIKVKIRTNRAMQSGQCYVKHGTFIWLVAFLKHSVSAALMPGAAILLAAKSKCS